MVRNVFYVSRGLFPRKNFVLARKHFFVSLLNLERNIYNIYPEFFRKSYQYCILGVWKNISAKVFPLKFIKITFSISNFERIFFGKFATTVVAWWTFSVILIRMKNKFFLNSRFRTKSGFLAEIFSRQFCQICSLRVRMNCLTNVVSLKDFFLFWTLSQNVQTRGAFFSSLVEAAFWSQEETFEAKFLSAVFGKSAKSFRSFGWTFSAGLTKLRLTCLKEYFEGTFLWGCQYCIPRIQRNHLSGNVFLKNMFLFFHFWDLRKMFSQFWQNFFSRVYRAAFNVSRRTI